MFGYSFKLIAGITLILTNQVVGWGGLLICTYLSRKSDNKSYVILGSAFYVLSWVMLFAGLVLAGQECSFVGNQRAKDYLWPCFIAVGAVLSGGALYARKKKRA